MQPRDPNHARGVDVSHYQGDIDWQQVKDSGISFAFIKATEGVYFTDDKFADNLQGARDAGIATGAYHFMRATSVDDAIAEADYFVDEINLNGGFSLLDLPPVLDAETVAGNSGEEITAMCRAWVDRVAEVTGRQPILYTYPSFADQYLDESLSDIPLWLANYGVDQPQDRAGWTHWTFLQYADDGEVPGIDGPVDLDEYEGSVEDLAVTGYQMSAEDANKIIAFLSAAYFCTEDTEARDEFHRLANEMRKASGQPEE
jgi:lysozyme